MKWLNQLTLSCLTMMCTAMAGDLTFDAKLSGSGRVVVVTGADLGEFSYFQQLKDAGYVPIGQMAIPRIEGTAYDINLEFIQEENEHFVMENKKDSKVKIPVDLYLADAHDGYIALSPIDQQTIPASEQQLSGNTIFMKVSDQATYVPAGEYRLNLEVSEVYEG